MNSSSGTMIHRLTERGQAFKSPQRRKPWHVFAGVAAMGIVSVFPVPRGVLAQTAQGQQTAAQEQTRTQLMNQILAPLTEYFATRPDARPVPQSGIMGAFLVNNQVPNTIEQLNQLLRPLNRNENVITGTAPTDQVHSLLVFLESVRVHDQLPNEQTILEQGDAFSRNAFAILQRTLQRAVTAQRIQATVDSGLAQVFAAPTTAHDPTPAPSAPIREQHPTAVVPTRTAAVTREELFARYTTDEIHEIRDLGTIATAQTGNREVTRAIRSARGLITAINHNLDTYVSRGHGQIRPQDQEAFDRYIRGPGGPIQRFLNPNGRTGPLALIQTQTHPTQVQAAAPTVTTQPAVVQVIGVPPLEHAADIGRLNMIRENLHAPTDLELRVNSVLSRLGVASSDTQTAVLNGLQQAQGLQGTDKYQKIDQTLQIFENEQRVLAHQLDMAIQMYHNISTMHSTPGTQITTLPSSAGSGRTRVTRDEITRHYGRLEATLNRYRERLNGNGLYYGLVRDAYTNATIITRRIDQTIGARILAGTHRSSDFDGAIHELMWQTVHPDQDMHGTRYSERGTQDTYRNTYPTEVRGALLPEYLNVLSHGPYRITTHVRIRDTQALDGLLELFRVTPERRFQTAYATVFEELAQGVGVGSEISLAAHSNARRMRDSVTYQHWIEGRMQRSMTTYTALSYFNPRIRDVPNENEELTPTNPMRFRMAHQMLEDAVIFARQHPRGISQETSQQAQVALNTTIPNATDEIPSASDRLYEFSRYIYATIEANDLLEHPTGNWRPDPENVTRARELIGRAATEFGREIADAAHPAWHGNLATAMLEEAITLLNPSIAMEMQQIVQSNLDEVSHNPASHANGLHISNQNLTDYEDAPNTLAISRLATTSTQEDFTARNDVADVVAAASQRDMRLLREMQDQAHFVRTASTTIQRDQNVAGLISGFDPRIDRSSPQLPMDSVAYELQIRPLDLHTNGVQFFEEGVYESAGPLAVELSRQRELAQSNNTALSHALDITPGQLAGIQRPSATAFRADIERLAQLGFEFPANRSFRESWEQAVLNLWPRMETARALGGAQVQPEQVKVTIGMYELMHAELDLYSTRLETRLNELGSRRTDSQTRNARQIYTEIQAASGAMQERINVLRGQTPQIILNQDSGPELRNYRLLILQVENALEMVDPSHLPNAPRTQAYDQLDAVLGAYGIRSRNAELRRTSADDGTPTLRADLMVETTRGTDQMTLEEYIQSLPQARASELRTALSRFNYAWIEYATSTTNDQVYISNPRYGTQTTRPFLGELDRQTTEITHNGRSIRVNTFRDTLTHDALFYVRAGTLTPVEDETFNAHVRDASFHSAVRAHFNLLNYHGGEYIHHVIVFPQPTEHTEE